MQSFLRPVYLLRIEALSVFLGSCVAYHSVFPRHWILFAWLFLAPDLSFLAYLGGSNTQASVAYNAVHSYILPAVLGLSAFLLSNALFGEICIIWIAHISFDRMLGYGLKYPNSFQFTHIQSVASPAIVSKFDDAKAEPI